MKRSTDRILTTHTGSLPWSMDLATMLEALDSGELLNQDAFKTRVREAAVETVGNQVGSGVNVVSDGEQGKVGYSTCVRHPLTGLKGEGSVSVVSDWVDFRAAITRQPQRSTVLRPSCYSPVKWKDKEPLQTDIRNFKAVLSASEATETFMTAASPGVVDHFMLNHYYPGREAHLARLAEVMREEYNAIHQAGFCCKWTALTWPWGII